MLLNNHWITEEINEEIFLKYPQITGKTYGTQQQYFYNGSL